MNQLPRINAEATDVAPNRILDGANPISLSQRIRQFTVVRFTAALIISKMMLGLVIYDIRFAASVLSGLFVAVAITAGFKYIWLQRPADVVVRIGESEVRIRFINMPLDGEQKQAFLTGLADYVQRQLHAQLEPHSDR